MRQKARKRVQAVFTVFMLPVVLLILVSPLTVYVYHLVNIRILLTFLWIVLILWITVFITSLLFQRAHCSHTCPITGFFIFLSYILKDKSILGIKYPRALNYIVLSVWFGSFIYVIVRFMGNATGLLHYEPIFSSVAVLLYFLLFFVSGILSLTIGKSKTEHYICPFSPYMIVGIKVSHVLGLPSFKFIIDKGKCRNCKMCNTNCLMNYDVCKIVNEAQFKQNECLNCAMCADACKFGAITYKWTV